MIPAEHPCLSAQAHFRYGRIHLPVAPRCNIRCGYCDRRYDCANESRPGVTSEVISPEAALDRVERALRLDSRLRVAGNCPFTFFRTVRIAIYTFSFFN